MYYKEEIIDGILYFKTTPNGEWRPLDVITLTGRLKKAEERVYLLETELETLEPINYDK